MLETLKKIITEQREKRAKGLFNKFIVRRSDGKHRKGKKHEHCQHFVLDINHDPYARIALRAYANACAVEYPNLALDLFKLLDKG